MGIIIVSQIYTLHPLLKMNLTILNEKEF